jgi:hypothetical protein
MFQFGHNKVMSMDVMFGANDVKYHLFTLMVFNFHHTKMLVVWIIQINKHVKIWWNG